MEGGQTTKMLLVAAAAVAVTAGAAYAYIKYDAAKRNSVAEAAANTQQEAREATEGLPETEGSAAPMPSGNILPAPESSVTLRQVSNTTTCSIHDDLRCPSDGLSTCPSAEPDHGRPPVGVSGGSVSPEAHQNGAALAAEPKHNHMPAPKAYAASDSDSDDMMPAMVKQPSDSSVGSDRSRLSSLRIGIQRTSTTFQSTEAASSTAATAAAENHTASRSEAVSRLDSNPNTSSAHMPASGNGEQAMPRPLRIIRDHAFTDDYELLESIGRGTFSVVRKCKHLASGQLRAVKCIDTHRFRLNPTFDPEALLAEVRILSNLHHAHIIRLFDVYYRPEDETIYSVTELAQGGELFDSILASGNFSEMQAKHVVWQVLCALQHMHARKVVHRDIKPENILVFSSRLVESAATGQQESMLQVKLADFGTSRFVSSGYGASTFVGSPQYVAPEILFARGGDHGYGTKVDVWSVGVTLFAMLGGYLPFDDAAHPGDNNSWEERIKAGKFRFVPPVWTHISAASKDLIRNMLTVNPDKRWSVEQCLEHPWLAPFNRGGVQRAYGGAQTAPLRDHAYTPVGGPPVALGAAASSTGGAPLHAGTVPLHSSSSTPTGRALGQEAPLSPVGTGQDFIGGRSSLSMSVIDIVSKSLDLMALYRLQKSTSLALAEAYDGVSKLPAAAEAVRKHAVACRDLQKNVRNMIAGFRDKADGVLELLTDLNIAVEDGDADATAALFGQLKTVIQRVKTESAAIQEKHARVIQEVQLSLERARALRESARSAHPRLLQEGGIGSGGRRMVAPSPSGGYGSSGMDSVALVVAGRESSGGSALSGGASPNGALSPSALGLRDEEMVDLFFDPVAAASNTKRLHALLSGQGINVLPRSELEATSRYWGLDGAPADGSLPRPPRHHGVFSPKGPQVASPTTPSSAGHGTGWSSVAGGDDTPASAATTTDSNVSSTRGTVRPPQSSLGPEHGMVVAGDGLPGTGIAGPSVHTGTGVGASVHREGGAARGGDTPLLRQYTGASNSKPHDAVPERAEQPPASPAGSHVSIPPPPSADGMSPLVGPSDSGKVTPDVLKLSRSGTANSTGSHHSVSGYANGAVIDISGTRQDSTVSVGATGPGAAVAGQAVSRDNEGPDSTTLATWAGVGVGPVWSPHRGGDALSHALEAAHGGQGGGVPLTLEEAEALIRALQQLQRVDLLLYRCVSFWGSMELVIDLVTQGKEHSEALLKSTKSARLMQRALDKMSSYREFWKAVSLLCERYVAHADEAPMYLFLGTRSSGPSAR